MSSPQSVYFQTSGHGAFCVAKKNGTRIAVRSSGQHYQVINDSDCIDLMYVYNMKW